MSFVSGLMSTLGLFVQELETLPLQKEPLHEP